MFFSCNWPRVPVHDTNTHRSQCTKLGSTRDIRDSKDPKGLEALYFLVQDLKCLALSLISLHFKVNPIPN